MKKEVILVGCLVGIFTLLGVIAGMSIQQQIFKHKIENIRKSILPAKVSHLKRGTFQLGGRRHLLLLERALKKLELTPQQKEEVKELLKVSKEKIKEVFKEAREKVHNIKKELQEKIYSLLTEEQKEKLKKLKNK